MFPKQHAGFNTDIVPVLLLEKNTQRECDMFALMSAIDHIDDFCDTEDYDDCYIYEYRFPQDTVHYYLMWLSQIWTGQVYNQLDEVRIAIDDYSHDNREQLRRAAMAGMI
jgi:hypothetical protein